MMVAFTSKKEQTWEWLICGLRAVNPMLPNWKMGLSLLMGIMSKIMELQHQALRIHTCLGNAD